MIRLAVSNLAWDPAEDAAIAELLRREGVRAIEIAPTKWRDLPYDAPVADVAELRRAWEDRGLRIVSIQSLLFGRPDLQLFGDAAGRTAFTDFLRRVIDFAGALGAGAMVFGSPKNRIRGAMTPAEAHESAVPVLRSLGDHSRDRDVLFCLEANPPEYGGDFLTTTAEARDLCRSVGHPNVRVNVDLGAMSLSGEDARAEIAALGDLVGHVHASEAKLAELGAPADHAPPSDHDAAAEGLASIGYKGCVSIEMLAAGAGRNAAAIQRAIGVARKAYGRLW